MRRYTLVQPFWLAFYSKSLYRDVRQNWQNVALVYLLLLVIICCLPFAYRLHARIEYFAQYLQPWFRQLPTLTIYNEKVSIEQPAPYYIIFFSYPIIVLVYFVQGLLEALVYAALAKIFIRTDLPYNILVRLAIVAITPKFILASALNLFPLMVPFRWILYFAVGMGYLFFAIEANRYEQGNIIKTQ
jgi:hypothetical protein